jgi:transposase
MLNRVERSFRYLKSSLGVRPNHHQREHRVEGHIFVSILAELIALPPTFIVAMTYR